eukprot:tig00020902_g15006.t1
MDGLLSCSPAHLSSPQEASWIAPDNNAVAIVPRPQNWQTPVKEVMVAVGLQNLIRSGKNLLFESHRLPVPDSASVKSLSFWVHDPVGDYCSDYSMRGWLLSKGMAALPLFELPVFSPTFNTYPIERCLQSEVLVCKNGAFILVAVEAIIAGQSFILCNAFLRRLVEPASSPPEPAPPPSLPHRPRSAAAVGRRPRAARASRAALPAPADVRQWREAHVVEWIRSRGPLAEFAPAFSYTDGPALLALTDGALREMGVAHAGARHRILSEAAALAAPAAPPPRHGSPGPAAAAADGKRWDLFLSYAHADAAVVFLVDRELKAGQRWMAKIGEAMNLCRAFLFFLSPAYVASKNWDDELQYAHHQLRLPKFPVWIADPKAVDLPVDYRMMLASVNWVQQRGGGGEVAAAVDAACWELFDGLGEIYEISQTN